VDGPVHQLRDLPVPLPSSLCLVARLERVLPILCSICIQGIRQQPSIGFRSQPLAKIRQQHSLDFHSLALVKIRIENIKLLETYSKYLIKKIFVLYLK
jgi:hypothetical protein